MAHNLTKVCDVVVVIKPTAFARRQWFVGPFCPQARQIPNLDEALHNCLVDATLISAVWSS